MIMEELMEILEDICPDVDFENETALVDDKIFSSFDILSIVSEISETFGIKLTPAEIIPENFNSAQALWNMIQRMRGE
jgi:acyl carrier protein